MHPGELLGRDDELATARACTSGLLVIARPGAGSSAFLAALAEQTGASLVAGREAAAQVPFVPVAALLRAARLAEAEPLAVLTGLPAFWLANGVRVVVDDADHLDAATAVVLAQAARLGVPVTVGARRIGDLLGGLRDVALTLPQLHLDRLSPAAADELADAVTRARTGERLDPPSLAAIGHRAGGLPVIVVDLLDGALTDGAYRSTRAGLHLTGLTPGAPSLKALGVTEADLTRYRALLRRLAVAGPLPADALGECAADLAVAAAAGLVSEREGEFDVAGQLIADRTLANLSAERREVLAAEAAAALAGCTAGPDPHRQRVAALADPSSAAPEVVIDVVAWLRARDRRDEALAVLDAAPSRTAAWHLARADVLADLGLLDEAVPELDAALDQAQPAEQAQVEAAMARRQVISGAPLADDLEDPLAELLRTSLTGSLAEARRGADPPADPDDDSLERHLRVLIHFLSLVYDGQIVEAREIAEHEYAAARRQARAVLGLWAYNRAKIALHAGQYQASVERGRDMRSALAWQDPFALRASGEALLASALARSGGLAEAEEIAAALSEEDLLLPRARLGVARVRAQGLIERGDRSAAAAVLAEAGHFAIAHDEAHSGLLGLDESFWVDPREEAAAWLLEGAERSGLARAFAQRSRGLLDGDLDLLTSAARDLEAMVQPGRAAATWRAVSTLAAERGDSALAGSAIRHSHRICLTWAAHPWPAPAHAVPVLSARELEVARHAAARRRSREIAADLGLSIRTVDNHLGRAFRKLDAGNREELAEALGVGPEVSL